MSNESNGNMRKVTLGGVIMERFRSVEARLGNIESNQVIVAEKLNGLSILMAQRTDAICPRHEKMEDALLEGQKERNLLRERIIEAQVRARSTWQTLVVVGSAVIAMGSIGIALWSVLK